MSSEEKSPLIWGINFCGVLLFVVGLFGYITTVRNSNWMVWSGLLGLTILGWFMMAIYVPHTYPKKLLQLGLSEFIRMSIFTVIFVTTTKMETKELIKWTIVLWVVLFISGIMIAVGGRIGTRLVRERITG